MKMIYKSRNGDKVFEIIRENKNTYTCRTGTGTVVKVSKDSCEFVVVENERGQS